MSQLTLHDIISSFLKEENKSRYSLSTLPDILNNIQKIKDYNSTATTDEKERFVDRIGKLVDDKLDELFPKKAETSSTVSDDAKKRLEAEAEAKTKPPPGLLPAPISSQLTKEKHPPPEPPAIPPKPPASSGPLNDIMKEKLKTQIVSYLRNIQDTPYNGLEQKVLSYKDVIHLIVILFFKNIIKKLKNKHTFDITNNNLQNIISRLETDSSTLITKTDNKISVFTLNSNKIRDDDFIKYIDDKTIHLIEFIYKDISQNPNNITEICIIFAITIFNIFYGTTQIIDADVKTLVDNAIASLDKEIMGGRRKKSATKAAAKSTRRR